MATTWVSALPRIVNMQPSEFLASLERHQREVAAQPDPAQEFVKTQFNQVIITMSEASKAMLKFLETYHPTTSVDNFPTSIKTPDVSDVTKAVKALEKSLKPSKQDNGDVVKAIQSLNKAVEKLELNPTYKPEIKVSPTPIKVAAPNVKVDAPDLKPITKAIKDNKPEPVDFKDVIKELKKVQKEIIQKPTPVANVPTDPLIYYLPSDIDDAGAVQYYGYTDNKGAWYIRRYDSGSSPKTLRFAFGQTDYVTNYTNRASLTYTIWGS